MPRFSTDIFGRAFGGALVGCLVAVVFLVIGTVRYLLVQWGEPLTFTLQDAGAAASLVLGCMFLGSIVGVVAPLARGTFVGWTVICTAMALSLLLIAYITGTFEAPSAGAVLADIIGAVAAGIIGAACGVYFWRRTEP
jgi:hypothetical protein